MRVWTLTQELLQDDEFMEKYTKAASRFLPLHIAFLYSGDKLISVASNTCAYGHAERNCIKHIRYISPKTHRPMKLVVVRIDKQGVQGMSRPCYDCCIMLKHLLPRARVFYTGYGGMMCEECHMDNSHYSLARRNKEYQRGNNLRMCECDCYVPPTRWTRANMC